jgi:hypothetical protein
VPLRMVGAAVDATVGVDVPPPPHAASIVPKKRMAVALGMNWCFICFSHRDLMI